MRYPELTKRLDTFEESVKRFRGTFGEKGKFSENIKGVLDIVNAVKEE